MDDANSPKRWAMVKQSRKYATPRDKRKSFPNGDTLKYLYDAGYNYDSIEYEYKGIEQNILHGFKNPIEEYLNIQQPNNNEIFKNFEEILYHTNYEQLIINNKGLMNNAWILCYRYSLEQQFQNYYQSMIYKKKLKNNGNEIPITKILKDKKYHNNNNKNSPKYKHYKIPYMITQNQLKPKISKIKMDERENRYIMFDLLKNKWVTSISTKYTWNAKEKKYGAKIDTYRILIGFDPNEKEVNYYNMQYNIHNNNNNNDKPYNINKSIKIERRKKTQRRQPKSKKSVNVVNNHNRMINSNNNNNRFYDNINNNNDNNNDGISNNRKFRKCARKQKLHDIVEKKENENIKWLNIGIFNGNLDDYYYNYNEDISIDKIHSINNNDQYPTDINKNGMLCRWIKVIPCNNEEYDFERLVFNIYGFEVNEFSMPMSISISTSNMNHKKNKVEIDEKKNNDTNKHKNDFQIKFRDNLSIYESDPNFIGCQITIKQKQKAYHYGRKMDGAEFDVFDYGGLGPNEYLRQQQKYTQYLRKKVTSNNWDVTNYI